MNIFKNNKSLVIMFMLAVTFQSGTSFTKELKAEDGLAKIDKNIKTSQSNINDIQTHLNIVNENLSNLNQSQAQLEAQKKTLLNLTKENDRILEVHKKEISKYEQQIINEKKSQDDELLKIQKLEQMIVQLKNQQEVRTKNIQEMAKNKDLVTQSKDKGIENQKQIHLATQEVDKNLQSLKKEATTWNQKRKSNEKELAQWTTERDNHQKMQDDLKTLMEN